MNSKSNNAKKIVVDKNLHFSCNNCGMCCRHWLVPITLTEKERIESLKVPNFDFKNSSKDQYFTQLTKSLYTINKKPDGACIFLNDKNLCILHSMYGEAVKSLACRLYPLDIFKWKDNTISVTLKFRCQSVKCKNDSDTANGNKNALYLRENDIRTFASEINSYSDGLYSFKNPANLTKIRYIQEAMTKILEFKELSLQVRLYSIAKIIDFHDHKKMYDAINNANPLFVEDAISFINNAKNELVEEFKKFTDKESLDVNNRVKLRFMLCNYVRTDENVIEKNVWDRIKNSLLHFKFAAGLASLKKLSKNYPDTSKVDILKKSQNCTLSSEAEELLYSYLHSKLLSGHFYSQPCLNLTFIQGIRHLLLSAIIINILSAVFANEDNRQNISEKDLRKSLSIIDVTFSASDVFKFSGMQLTEKKLSNHKLYAVILSKYCCINS